MALTLTERVSLGDVDARRTLCGTYVDTRTGGEIMVTAAARPFAVTLCGPGPAATGSGSGGR